MAEILTREDMLERMVSQLENSAAIVRRAQANLADPKNIASAAEKENVSEETAKELMQAYLAGFTAATQPWVALLQEFSKMPLYRQNKRHTK